jgi:peptidoglycan hydrolase FlgJ
MTLPVTSSTADIYTDLAGLTALKKSAHNNDPEALRQVAKQYESLFARMMIKSMRDAVGKDPLFGSDEGQTYQEMYDDQLSIELTKGKGLGLADMLVRQMQRLTGSGRTDSTDTQTGASKPTPGTPDTQSNAITRGGPDSTLPARAKAALRFFQEHGGTPAAASPATQSNFISEVWPAAQQAGEQLGIDPRNIIAQAALETNWGTRVPRDPNGRSSNNLFGIKAGAQWSGSSVSAQTREYENGTAVGTSGHFRAYDSREKSFQDYVSMIRSNPRYTAALNTGNNTQAFAAALQRGGYATDPDYASKITAIATSIRSHASSSDPTLKSASARPINANAETL